MDIKNKVPVPVFALVVWLTLLFYFSFVGVYWTVVLMLTISTGG